MRRKQNQHAQAVEEHKAEAWSLNLPPPLTSASDLMAHSVSPFKMSHRGTVNTSISQCAPGSTLAGTLKWEMQ